MCGFKMCMAFLIFCKNDMFVFVWEFGGDDVTPDNVDDSRLTRQWRFLWHNDTVASRNRFRMLGFCSFFKSKNT